MPRQKPTANKLLSEGPNHAFLGRLTSFNSAYPAVASVRVTGKQEGDGVGSSKYDDGTVLLTDRSGLPQFVDCRNPQCYGGGFHIGQIIDSMVQARDAHKEMEYLPCVGHEGSRRRNDGPCANSLLNVAIEITYRPATGRA